MKFATNEEKSLLDLMDDAGFGSIRLRILNGKPCMDKIEVHTNISIDKDDWIPRRQGLPQGMLSREQSKTLQHLRQIKGEAIVTITFTSGKPSRIELTYIHRPKH